MKPSLQLRVNQSLTITPQLQQAIRLLQLSSMELHTEIQNALESNMMLEVDNAEQNDIDAPLNDEAGATELNTVEKSDDGDDLFGNSDWDNSYGGGVSYPKRNGDNSNYDFENQLTKEWALKEHLKWQLNLTPMSDTDKIIALAIIDLLGDDGYLSGTFEDILASVTDDEDEETIDTEEIEAVLKMVQTMDPPGVGSRDLKECLNIQLRQYPEDTPCIKRARTLINNYLELLAAHDYPKLMRKMKINREELAEVVQLIQSMNPKPGYQIDEARIPYITPDVYVKKVKNAWKVDLNMDAVPPLRINKTYANMIRRADNSADNNYLKTHLQEARWFIKSLISRSETLLRVAACIVEQQRAFLEYGEEAMKPLVMKDVAEMLDMHESTISRVTTLKYMHTPRGLFELKYFFSSQLSTNYGGACSSTAIRALIKKLIRDEPPDKPLSDSKISALLKEQGVNVARRTVAKYREAMIIPPSNERKRFS